MIQRIVAIVFPLFAVVLAGYLYARKRPTDMTVANRLNFDVFLPALVFTALAGKSFDLVDNLPLALGAIAVTFGSGLLAWPLARPLGVDVRALASTAMFNNVGNMGLPLLLFAFGEGTLGAAVMLLPGLGEQEIPATVRLSLGMAMLFLLEERQLHQQTRPLLSGRDIRALLNHFLPRRDTTLEEVLRQMEVRHRKRQAAIDSAYRKQQLNE